MNSVPRRLHSPLKVQTGNEARGPLLLIMGGKDHTVPEVITKSTLKQLEWLEKQGFQPPAG